jgi:uncharacterized protein YneF (UPF0154 family)
MTNDLASVIIAVLGIAVGVLATVNVGAFILIREMKRHNEEREK